MTSPAIQATGNWTSGTTNITSHVITIPTHQAGDLLVVNFAVDGNPTCTASGSWNKLGQASNSTVVTGAIFWIIASGSGTTLTITTTASEQSSANVYVIRPSASVQNTTWSIEGTSSNGSSTNSNPPQHVHTSGLDEDTLFLATRAGDSTVVATVAPTNYGSLLSQAAGGTNGASANSASDGNSAAGNNTTTEDPGTFTSASEQWVCWTLAIRYAPTYQAYADYGDAIGFTDVASSSHEITLSDIVFFPKDIVILCMLFPTGGYTIGNNPGFVQIPTTLSLDLWVWEVPQITSRGANPTIDVTSFPMGYVLYVIRPASGHRLTWHHVKFAEAAVVGTSTPSSPNLDLGRSRVACWLTQILTTLDNQVISGPASYTQFVADDGTVNKPSLGRAVRRNLTAQSEDPGNFSTESSSWHTMTMGIWDSVSDPPIRVPPRIHNHLMR